MITISNNALEAQVTPWRAELVALRRKGGEDYLWDGNPEVWKGHSPILFPIVGMVPDNTVKIRGQDYTLLQHGFTPRINFEVLTTDTDRCTLRLEANDETRAAYPYDFRLDISYTLTDLSITLAATVTNTSNETMPYSFGFHPGFCWPLPGSGSREDHFLEFEHIEASPIRRPKNGLLDPLKYPTPVEGHRLQLEDSLFENGAVMFDEIESRRVGFGSNTGNHLDVRWRNLPHLGIWSQKGANYLCIEPWQGYSALEDFVGELADKPGVLHLPAGRSESFEMTITLVEQPLGPNL